MYSWQYSEVAKAQLARMPYELVDGFVETMAHVSIDPWNFQRQPDEPDSDHHAYRTVAFANGLGMVTFLILEHVSEVHVSRILWLG